MKRTIRLAFLAMLLLPGLSWAQMSGSYTINPSGSGTSNFTSISAAISSLYSNGVNGPVTFTVANGSHSNAIQITSSINGLSATNNITFDGQDATKCEVKASYPVYISTYDYINVKNFTLTPTSLYGVYLNSADYCKVEDCIINGDRNTSSTSYRGVYMNTSNNDTIRNCEIYGMYYATYIYGTSSTTYNSNNNAVIDCEMKHQYDYPIYNYYSSTSLIEGNTIDSLREGSFGYKIYTYYSNQTKVKRNKVFWTSGYGYGIYCYYENYYPTASSSGYRSQIENNFVGGQGSNYTRPIYITTNSSRIDVLHNTLVSGYSSTSSYGLYCASGTGHNIQNNNIQLATTAGGYALYVSSASYVDTLDYNNIYSYTSSGYAYFAGARSSLAALKSYNSSYNQNSISVAVPYSNMREWDQESAGLNNQANNNVGVTEDINGNPRPTSPDTDNDIGCLDYYLPPNDAGVSGFPVSASCAGTATVDAFITNYGTATLTSATLNWAISVNNGAFTTQSTASFSGSLGSGASATVTLGSFTLANGKVYTIKSWTTSPNSSSDGKAVNDTSYTTMAPAMAGTFTIGGSGADYSKIGDAVAVLSAYGVCGPVTLRLNAGTFNERVVLGSIAGTSSANTIRIVGQGKDNTSITYSSSSASDYSTILLDGTDHVTLDSMTIEAASTTNYGSTVWFTGGADSNNVTNCDLLGDPNNTGTTARLNVVFSASATSYSTYGVSGEWNTIQGCLIRGGYFNVALYGSGSTSVSTYNLGNSFIDNELYKAYYYGFYYLYSGQKTIEGNIIDSVTTSSGYAMRNYYCSRDRIIGNVMNGNAYGMYQYYANYTGYSSADTTYIFNNMFSAAGTAGLYLYGNYQTLTYNNSVYCSGSYGAYFGIPYYGSEARNNSFQCDGSYAVYLNTTSSLVSSTFFDYNNYYAPNGSVAYHGGDRSTLSDWQTAYSSHNTNSISADPVYNSTTDLHSLSQDLNNAGVDLWHISDDIDGDTRPFAPDLITDIGADEYYLAPYDLDVVSISPSVYASGNNNVTITVRNTGINNIVNDSAYVSYTVGTGTPVKDTIFITRLNIGADSTFTFAAPYNVTSSASFTICGSIDGGIAGDPDTDDEVCENACVGSLGTYTIDATGNGDFTTFADAVSSLNGCGVAGNVIFNVVAGTYNERVEIKEINGVGPNATITFRGDGRDKVTLAYSASTTSDWATVLLDGADYVRFEDMTIEANSSSYGATVWFTNSADYNQVNNCDLIGQQGVSAGSSNRLNVVFSGSSTSRSTYGAAGNYNTIEGCLVNGGYYNIQLYGAGTTTISSFVWGNSFIDCELTNAYYYGLYCYYGYGMTTLQGCTIDNIYSSSGYGVYMYLYSARNRIIGNVIHGQSYGLYHYYDNYTGTSVDDTTYVFNNIITATGTYGIYTYYGYRTKWYHNSVYSAGTYGAYFGYPYYSQTRNNNFYGNSTYAVYLNTTSTLVPSDFFDYNNYYAPNGSVAYHGGAIATLAAWQTAYSSHNINSISVDPEYTNVPSDLHTRSLNLNNAGTNLVQVTTDIDGEARPLSPDVTVDIGADEYYLPPWDADLQKVGPASLAAGNNTITAEFLNEGTTTWNGDTIYVEYTVDGGAAVKDTVFTGTVANQSIQNYSFDVPYNQTAGGPYKEICVRINPAFKTDPDSTADTLCISACTPASGTYVVDASGNGDFLSVADAADYLNCASIVGPVTIRIKNGTYGEQVNLNALNGASATNTIRFVGESTNAEIAGNYGATDNWMLKLDGADYITFDSLTISNSNTDGVTVFMTNAADYNTIKNCVLEASSVTTSSVSAIVRLSQSSTTASGYGNTGNYNTFMNNECSGGYYGFSMVGSSTSTRIIGNQILNSTIEGAYAFGIYTYYTQESNYSENAFSSIVNSSGYSIVSVYCTKSSILGNKMESARFGAYILYENTFSTSDTSYIVNNMCSNFDYGTQEQGIYVIGYNVHLLHNSIWANSSSNTATYASLYVSSTSGCVVKNNVVANTKGTYAVYKEGTFDNGDFDYNAYYAPNSTIAYYDAANYADLSAWKSSVSTQNVNSIEVNPGFISIENLHSYSDSINNKGDNANSWSTDFDGDSRPTSPDITVDMGADDYWIPLRDLDIVSIDAPTSVVIGNNSITATFQNRGLRDLNNDTALVSYSINGGTAVSDTVFLSNLKVGDQTQFTFATQWTNSADASFNICVSIDTLLSSAFDPNDEMCINRCTGAKDTITVDATGGGDYTTISAAVDKLNCGVLGDVVIYVKKGTYNESVTLANVAGMSRTNTVSIVGEDRSGVVWNAASGEANTITLNGADYVSISNMTIRNMNTNTIAGTVIMLGNQADNVTIDNCDLMASTSTTNSQTSVVAASSNLGITNYTGRNADSLTLSNCLISGAYQGVSLVGGATTTYDNGNVISNNTFVDNYQYNIFSYSQSGVEISNNEMGDLRNTSGTNLYSYYGNDATISGNSIMNENGYCIYMYFQNYYLSNSSNKSNIYNNLMVQDGTSAADNAYLVYAYYTDFYHNTSVTNTSYNSCLEHYYSIGSTIKNNIFNAMNNGYTAYIYSGTWANNSIDNNNYYGNAANGERFYYNFGDITGLSNFQSGQNANSVAVDPYFVGTNDYRASAWQLIGAGADLDVAMDIEGDMRDANNPDIGADEINKNLTVTMLDGPLVDCRAPGTMGDVKVTFTNNGPSALTPGDSLYITYKEGTTMSTDTLVVPSNVVFSAGMSTDYTFNHQLNIGAAGNHDINVWTDYMADTVIDDTLKADYFTNPYPKAGFTVTEACLYDESEFTDASTITLGSVTSWSWNFGNGSSSSMEDPSNQYATADTFDVMLVVSSDSGCTDTTYGNAITNPVPSANFSTANVCHREEASFTNASTLAYGTMSYSWDFGDNTNTSNATDPDLTYANDGSFDVELITSSDEGCVDTATKSISIYPTPNPAFTATEECKDNATSFTNKTTVSSGSYSLDWSFGDGNTSTSTNPTNTYATNGSYTAKLVTSTSNGCSDSVTATVRVNPLPTSAFQAVSMCFGDTLRPVDNSTGNLAGYLWYWGDGTTSTGSAPEHRYASSGNYDVSLVVTTDKGCTDSSSTQITVATQPQSAFVASIECEHDDIQFTNQTSVACGVVRDYLWIWGDGNTMSTSSSANQTHRYAANGTYTAQLVITLANGFKDTSSQTVTVLEAPSASFTNNATCEGKVVQFTSTSTAGAGTLSAYSWAFGDGGSSTLRNPTNTYSTSGAYTVQMIAIDNNGCRDTVTTSVTASPNPKASFAAANDCAGDTIDFTNNSTISSGTNTYAWSFGDNTSSTLSAPRKVYNSASYYTVKLVATSNANCKDSATKTIQAYPLPTASISASDVCDNEAVKFSNLSSGAASYAWNFGDNSGTSSATAPSYTYGSSGSYTVEMTATSSNGCVDVASTSVTVNALPSAAFTAADQCDGDQVTFSNSSSGASSYSWSYGDGSGSTLANPKHTYRTDGSYYVELTATSSAGCEDEATDTVNINALPTAAFSSADECDGDALSFTNNSSGAASYAWDFGDNSGTSSATAPKYTYSTTGTYSVELTATTAKGCEDVVTRSYTVNPNPTAAWSAANVCDGKVMSFSNTSSIASGTMNHSWDFGDKTGTSNNTSPSYTYGGASTYTVQLEVTSDKGCTDNSSKSVTVYANPVANFSASNVCLSDAMSFTNSTTGASTYSWDFGDGSNSVSTTNPSHTYTTAGTYTVELTATSSNGCEDVITKKVTVYTNPSVSFTATNVCDGVAMTTTNSTSGATSYAWDFGDGSNSTATAPSHTYASNNNYTVKLVGTSSNGCKDSNTTSVSVYALPQVGFTASTECEGTATTFTNSSTGASSYSWSYGDGTIGNATSPTYTYAKAGTYSVQLTATSSNNCSASATNSVTVNSSPTAAFKSANICAEDSMRFANNSTGAASYMWYFGDGDSSTSMSPAHYYATEADYNVRLVASSTAGCIDETAQVMTVNDKPDASYGFTYQNSAALDCEDEKLNYAVDSIQSNVITYEWNFGDGTGASYGRAITKSWPMAGTYTTSLKLTTVNGCTDMQDADITIHANPDAYFVSNDTCLTDSIQFSNKSTSVDNVSYNWDFNDGNITSAENPIHAFTNKEGVYEVELTTTTINGCVDIHAESVSIYAIPTADFAIADVCNGDTSAFLNASSISTGTLSFDWNFGDANTSQDSNPEAVYASAGEYDVVLTVTSDNGCQDVKTVKHQVFVEPDARIVPPSVLCQDQVVQIPDSITNAFLPAWTVSYNDGNGNVYDSIPTITYATDGNYTPYWTVTTENGCYDSSSAEIEVRPLPTATWTYKRGEDGEITFTPDSMLTGYTYSWDFGDGNTSTDEVATNRFTTAGNTDVTLTVTASNGCSRIFLRSVEIFPTGVEKIGIGHTLAAYPNPFTTNTNVVYTLETSAYVKMEVYDMQGRLLSTITDGNQTEGRHQFELTGSELSDVTGSLMLRVIVDNQVHNLPLVRLR